MKSLKVYDPIHHEVKLESVRQKRTVPNFTSDLLEAALKLFRAGKLKIDGAEATAGAATKPTK